MQKTILIVGANSFIAKSMVLHLEAAGYACMAAPRSELDMEDETSIIRFVEKSGNLMLDGIIFCQGINPDKNVKDTSMDHIEKMWKVNIGGPIILLKHLHFKLNNAAPIIFFSSVAVTKGSYDPAYAAAKSAIYGLIQSLANEFAHLRFNAIALGLVENSPVYNKMTEDFREKHRKNMKEGKFIQTEDIGVAVVELLNNISINRSIVPLTGTTP